MTVAIILTLLAGGIAEAKDGERREGRGRGEESYRPQGRWSDDGPRFERPEPYEDRQRRQRWGRGERLPGSYWSGAVDYRSNRLRRPPSGYHWVQVGGDFLLMDSRSGLVLDVVPGR